MHPPQPAIRVSRVTWSSSGWGPSYLQMHFWFSAVFLIVWGAENLRCFFAPASKHRPKALAVWKVEPKQQSAIKLVIWLLLKWLYSMNYQIPWEYIGQTTQALKPWKLFRGWNNACRREISFASSCFKESFITEDDRCTQLRHAV